ncbi:MAG: FecR family protein [Phocaeicola sp.]
MNNIDEVIGKFLRKECTEEELVRMNNWLKESDENARRFFQWEEAYYIGQHSYWEDKCNTNKAEKSLFDRIEREGRKRGKGRFFYRMLQYAALFVGVATAATAGYSAFLKRQEASSMVTVTSGDSVRELLLGDGTKVWLNKYTTFKYSDQYNEINRSVYLDGEAYFEVEKNPKMPFVVQSKAMQVRVLGTTFNLKSEAKKPSAVATLVHGEIEVKGNNEEGLIVLSPGQKAELNGVTKRLVVKQVDTGIDKWNTNEFVFKQADIYMIARTLEQYYGVKLILDPEIDAKSTYSGSLKKKDTVGEMLNLITHSIPVRFKVVGNSVFLSSK